MHPSNSTKLPNDAMKAILTFMTRKKLIALSMLNRQFAHVIHSPPLMTKRCCVSSNLKPDMATAIAVNHGTADIGTKLM